MLRWVALRTAAVLALAAPADAALAADAAAAVVVADDGGLEVPAVRAIRSVTAAELRKRGLAVSEDARQELVQPVDARLAGMLQEIVGAPPPRQVRAVYPMFHVQLGF